MEAASKPAKQMRWHPAVLRWAVAIHTKSAAAYNVFCGQRIQWTDFIAFMEWDQGIHRANPGLRLAPKLTPEHLYLTPGPRMKVRLATQIGVCFA
ncbi:hypothetical protein HOLleu_16697 [Holothuria leucospilota]|uniref:Uncharacterized protein n=1 Tax=Holothuria leucospilota TaxID=206669 RepID=A0A9Q1C5J9_HOLLE|nr:hypothetical protein HOLleu_16697 [Holothuria leucospilota]